jgi:hypothetical protein
MPNIMKIEFVFRKISSKIIIFFSLLKSVKPVLMPIVWFDDEARIFPDVHSELTTLVVSLNIANYIKFILPSMSLLLILISSIYIFVQVRFQFSYL